LTALNAAGFEAANFTIQNVWQFSDVEIKAAREPPRSMFFSSYRAAHQQLSSVAQSYPQVQRFLAEGSDRALGKL
jgi:hypothetical protein